MNRIASAPGTLQRAALAFAGRDGAGRQGAQLALAVLAAYASAAALGLPEAFWAVMSALIVVRADRGSTLGAGWERVRGTLAGTACGVAGVWLHRRGASVPVATLGIVAPLAFASAAVPALRTAAITTMIVLAGGGLPGHSAWGVAGARSAEVLLGVAAGFGITLLWPGARALPALRTECAALLRLSARQLDGALGGDPPAPGQAEAANAAMRKAVRRIVQLGDSADLEARWAARLGSCFGRRAPLDEGRWRRLALLVARTTQDASLLGRLRESMPRLRDDALWRGLGPATADALERAAAAIGSRTPAATLATTSAAASAARYATRPATTVATNERREPLQEALRAATGAADDEAARLVAGPLRLLGRDLRALESLGRGAAGTGKRAGEDTNKDSRPALDTR